MKKIIAILLLSIPIFQYKIYWFLVEELGVGLSYAIDQLLPLIITGILAFIVIKKYIPINEVRKYISINIKPILLIIFVTLIVHGWVVGNYFMGEEPNTILRQVNTESKEAFVQGILRGYHYGVYILSYELFSTNSIPYNIVALLLYIVTAIVLYIFLNQLLKGKILPALIGTLFFVTTPAYLDMFFWQSNFSGMPIALSAGILSVIFLFAYQKNLKFIYYLLSIMFFLSMLKISFTRLHGFIALPLYMCLFPLSLPFKLNLKKSFYLALPYLSIFFIFLTTVFLLPDHSFEKGVTVKGTPLNTQGYFEVLSMFIAYLFMPSKFAETYYPLIKQFLLEHLFIPTNISLTLIIGIFCIIALAIIFLTALRNIREAWGRLIIFALVAIFANLVLTPLFIQGYNDSVIMDQRFSNTGVSNGPGIRYVFVSAMGLSMLVAVVTYWVVVIKKKCIRTFLILIFLFFVYYSYLNIASYIIALKNINPGVSSIPNSIFSMVPRDGKQKLLYSANPEKNTIDGSIGEWLHAFYKANELTYINSLPDVKNLIASGKYQKSNFYAFYNNPTTQTFKDVSELAKYEFYNKLDRNTNQIFQDVNLITSFVETHNPSFPSVLSRGIYISEDSNQRLLLPQEVLFLVHKNIIPNRSIYIDAFNVQDNKKWRGSPFPMAIWDMLKNKPLIVDIGQLNIPLSVKSLDNRTINTLSFESRMQIANELIKRENSNNKDEIIMSDVEKINKHYIDNQEILDIFQNSPSFNSLSLVYACAEDSDWEKQNEFEESIGGIWFVKEFPLTSNINEEISISITCFGSILRKIIWVGPPIPGQISLQAI